MRTRRKISAPLLAPLLLAPLLIALVLVGTSSLGSAAPSSPARAAHPPTPTDLTIMEFNIEYGGTGVDFGKVVEAVQASGASLVAIEEAEGNMGRLAQALGWSYCDPRRQLVSQYPLFGPPNNDSSYAYVAVGTGAIAIGNVHLPSWPYSPNLILKHGANLKEVLAAENKARVPQMQKLVGKVSGAPDSPVQLGVPTFILGDFNSPSNLDYVPAMVGTRPQIKYPVEWPVTKALQDAGFTDSYRAIHSDPTVDAGLTWPAARPKIPGQWNPPADAPQDRIDYIFSTGTATPTDSQTMGEIGGPGVWKSVDPWPSDHRALVSRFSVTPGTPPALVAPNAEFVATGSTLTVNYISPTTPAAIVAVTRGTGRHELPTPAGQESAGSVGFDTTGWAAGTYVITLADGGGTTLATASVWIQEPGSHPEIATTKTAYRPGEPIRVRWKNAPGNRWDWVGIYERGANPNVDWYLDWAYTGATVQGSLTFNEKSHGPWPLKPGKYSVYLLVDDSYNDVAEGRFTVLG